MNKAPPAPAQTQTGIKQTIQARHGVATYVPQGYTIKIINTYGKQVVDTWAFALHAPPEDSDIDKGEKDEANKDEADQEKAGADGKVEGSVETSGEAVTSSGQDPEANQEEEKDEQTTKKEVEKTTKETTEKAEDVAEDVKSKGQDVAKDVQAKGEDVASSAKEQASEATEKVGDVTEKTTEATKEAADQATAKTEETAKKSRWSAYIPSLPQRSPTKGKKKEKPAPDESKADENMSKSWSQYLGISGGEAGSSNVNSQSKGWSAYIPSGQGFSSYLPTKATMSAFAGSHYRDPTKSYAEQLYDFSKTPVGAAALSAGTGSGYAGSLYAAYKAYETTAADRSAPAMEFMSMQHSRASTLHLSPRVGDTLVSNLRAPLLTVVEDTSPGVHDTLIAACDPQRYKELGAEKWEEHGSCSENCVLALKEINEKSGLKGKRAIGADVTVNTVPAPLNLFMNIPWTDSGDISFEAPKTKRGDYIKLRAERDVVVVMSACPQDILAINGHKPMVAHFVVESSSEEDQKAAKKKAEEADSILAKARRRMSSQGKVPKAKKAGEEGKAAAETPKEEVSKRKESMKPLGDPTKVSSPVNQPRPGRKAPKKLEKRGSTAQSPGPSAKAS